MSGNTVDGTRRRRLRRSHHSLTSRGSVIGRCTLPCIGLHVPPTRDWMDLALPAWGALVGIALTVGLRAAALSWLSRLAARTSSRVDDLIVKGVRGPIVLWGALVGLRAGLAFSPYESGANEWLHRAIVSALILSIAWTGGAVAGAIVRVPSGVVGALPSARILSTAIRTGIVVLGLLVALQTVGVSVAPILTAMGVGGLAVGLALQDTLANLFAGFHILVSRHVRPGDFVQLSSGEQGFVEDVGWRNTTVRQLSNNIVIVPNAQLAKAVTLNYSLPDNEQAVLVAVSVSYDEDLDEVERVTVEVAAEVQREVDGAIRTFVPFIRYHSLSDSSIDFTVIMRAATFTDNYLMTHEFLKRLVARYRGKGITIPYPQRVLHVAAEDAALTIPHASGPTSARPR